MSVLWDRHLEREIRRYRDGRARMPYDARKRERQLIRIGSAAWGAGLSSLMLGDARHARSWLVRAARDYRTSAELALPGAWGRFTATLKSRLIAGDEGGTDDAQWTLAAGAATSESLPGQYAACLASLIVGEDADAAHLAQSLADTHFPKPVAAALGALATGASDDYCRAVGEVLSSFETRQRFLENFSYNSSAVDCAKTAGAKCILGANPAYLSAEALRLAVNVLDGKVANKPKEILLYTPYLTTNPISITGYGYAKMQKIVLNKTAFPSLAPGLTLPVSPSWVKITPQEAAGK